MSLIEQLQQIDKKVAEGRLVESAETFYDKSARTSVQRLVSVGGKAAVENLRRMEELLGDQSSIHIIGQRAIEDESATVSLVSFDNHADNDTTARFKLLALIARRWNDAGKVIEEEYMPVRSTADAQAYFPETRLSLKQIQPRLSFIAPTRKRRAKGGGRPRRPVAATDLHRIPTIGKSVVTALNQAGLSTFEALSSAGDDVLEAVRSASGRRFVNFDPSYWREAAKKAFAGEWDDIPAPPRAAKKQSKRGSRVDATQLGDRDIDHIERVGPNLLKAFHSEGIETFQDLAVATDEQLERLREKGGRPFVNFDMTYFRLAAEKKVSGANFLPSAPKPGPKANVGLRGRQGRPTNPNDLHILPGVGAQLVKAFHERGINTFGDIAEADRELLAEARAQTKGKYKNIDLGYLQRQAKYAAAEKFDKIDPQVKIEKSAKQTALSAIERQRARLERAGETDLQALPGIGASVRQAMNERDIHTFSDLTEASLEALAEVAQNAGKRFARFDVSFWKDVAGKAMRGEFDEIPAKAPVAPKPEKAARVKRLPGEPRIARPPRTPRDNKDLGALPSIGATIISSLNDAGINTFAQLSAASIERLEAIRAGAGPKYKTFPVAFWKEIATLAKDGNYEYPPTPRKAKKEKGARKAREVKTYEPTDLRALNNVGKSMAAALRDNGIQTWQDILDAPNWMLGKAASEAGRRFKNLNPEELKKSAKDATNGKFPEPTKRTAKSQLPEGAQKLAELPGIGKGVQTKLFERGILTYSDMANASVATLEEVRDEVGKRVARADVRKWKEFATYAAKGEWSKVDPEKFQDDANEADAPKSKRPKAPTDGDDLTKVKGIGPQAQQMFRSRGITTWQKIVDMEANALMALLDDSGARVKPDDYAKVQKAAAKLIEKKGKKSKG